MHKPVLFLFLKPDPRRSVSLEVPAVGHRFYKTLLDAIYRMDLDVSRVELAYATDVRGLETKVNLDRKVVAIGKQVGEVLQRKGKFDYYQFPAIDNSKKLLTSELLKCKDWIYETVKEKY